MKHLPATDATLFIRTHFANPQAWQAICDEIRQPPEDMMAAFAQFASLNAAIGQDIGEKPEANLTIVDDPAFANLTPEQLIASLPPASHHAVLFIADEPSMTKPGHPILVVDLFETKGRTFRSSPAQIQAIENNLSIANLDFAEFVDAVDSEGVFRGF